jgi:hypothetical protein
MIILSHLEQEKVIFRNISCSSNTFNTNKKPEGQLLPRRAWGFVA